jgi:hypothetical protein
VTPHRFDPVAFVLGGLAVAAGVVVLAGGSLTDEARILLPAGLIALGVALLGCVARREPRATPVVPPPPATPDSSSPSSTDLDWDDLDRS